MCVCGDIIDITHMYVSLYVCMYNCMYVGVYMYAISMYILGMYTGNNICTYRNILHTCMHTYMCMYA